MRVFRGNATWSYKPAATNVGFPVWISGFCKALRPQPYPEFPTACDSLRLVRTISERVFRLSLVILNPDPGLSSSVRSPFSKCLLCFGGWPNAPRLICKSPTVACGELISAMTPNLQQPFSGMGCFSLWPIKSSCHLQGPEISYGHSALLRNASL
jgi:hypothetical protein